MKRSDVREIAEALVRKNPILARSFAESIKVEDMVLAVIKGPKGAQKIYLKIREKEKDKGKAARIAWHQWCLKNPDSPHCSKHKKGGGCRVGGPVNKK